MNTTTKIMSTTFGFKTKEEAEMYSDRITYAVAAPLMADYYRRPDSLKVELSPGVITVLKGLRFKAEHIQELISQQGVTDLYLMFATSPTNAQNITIIAGGVVDPLEMGGELQKGILYDFCEPCPNRCPTNM